ncbi:beta-aspartyl-peptidase [Silanimonas sp.]|jgi:beta-aspartyl-dipeptidase (metallo-type)|uniref:beta-aspartyl-peptidase n=1 Tax=Silanimonas sp. TaxID=1929290 RepID=UPI0037C75217
MPELLWIRDAELMTPAPAGRGDVLVANGRILAMGKGLDPRGCGVPVRIVDAAGHWLCPGLVDGLVHFGGGGGEGGFATRMPPLAAATALAAGVTTMVGALGTDDVTRSHADLLACARALAASGLSAYTLTGSYQVPPVTLTGSVRGDLAFIPEMIGLGEIAIADHRGSQPSAAELARLASDARVGGMLAGKAGTVLVHCGEAPEGLALLREASSRWPVPIKQWHPTHVNRNARLLADGFAFVREGGSIDFTTSSTPDFVAAGEIPAALALADALAAGLPIERLTMSSDGQASLPHFDAQGRLVSLEVAPIGSLHGSVREAVELHRLPLATALAAATSSPAAIWGLSTKGSIAPGRDADLILLDRDTLALRWTMAGGRL